MGHDERPCGRKALNCFLRWTFGANDKGTAKKECPFRRIGEDHRAGKVNMGSIVAPACDAVGRRNHVRQYSCSVSALISRIIPAAAVKLVTASIRTKLPVMRFVE